MAIKIHAGLRIGRLTVVEIIESPFDKPGVVWKCVCTCGNWVARKSEAIKIAIMRDTNCGCLRCIKEDNDRKREIEHSRWRDGVVSNFRFGKIVSRTVEDMFFVIDGMAARLTKAELEEKFGPSEEESFTDDEIDPSFYDK